MIDVTAYMDVFLQSLHETFGDRVWFVGLQGSYGREEATEDSDLDLVVILDSLSASDLCAYDALLDTLPHRELICGFFSGKKEILHWEPSDLFQFYYDTKPVFGSLDDLLPLIDIAAVDRAIKIGACNIYHGCVHNLLHEKSGEILRGLYKSASFVARAIAFRQNGRYVSQQKDLLEALKQDERTVLELSMELKKGREVELQSMSEILLACAGKWIAFGLPQ